jgi:hypothetical protein
MVGTPGAVTDDRIPHGNPELAPAPGVPLHTNRPMRSLTSSGPEPATTVHEPPALTHRETTGCSTSGRTASGAGGSCATASGTSSSPAVVLLLAATLNLLALENGALSGQDAEAAKVRVISRRRSPLDVPALLIAISTMDRMMALESGTRGTGAAERCECRPWGGWQG